MSWELRGFAKRIAAEKIGVCNKSHLLWGGKEVLVPYLKPMGKNFKGTMESLRHVPDTGVGIHWA